MGAVPVPVNPLLQYSEDYDHYFADSLARIVLTGKIQRYKLRAVGT
jgi:hypothetical protein